MITKDKITSVFIRLGIKYKDKVNHKGWMACLCPNPSHIDNHYGNCSVNINSGIVSCFSCFYSRHIVGVVQDVLHLPFDEAQDFVGIVRPLDSIDKINAKKKQIESYQKEPLQYKGKFDYTFSYEEFDPINCYYTSIRGWTTEWVKNNDVVLATSGRYKDYAIIPIIDESKGIYSFEARKVYENKYLGEFFKNDSFTSCSEMKDKFNQQVEDYEVKYKNGKVYIKNEEINDPVILYLMQPKVLYPMNSQVYRTLFNIAKLEWDLPIAVSEGTASIPKMLQVYKNSTCIFGAKLDDEQIEYLRKFPEVILIPDNDEASDSLIMTLHNYHPNVKVIQVDVDDTHPDFVNCLRCESIEANRYLSRKVGII